MGCVEWYRCVFIVVRIVVRKKRKDVIPTHATIEEEWAWWERQNPAGANRARTLLDKWRREREGTSDSRLENLLNMPKNKK